MQRTTVIWKRFARNRKSDKCNQQSMGVSTLNFCFSVIRSKYSSCSHLSCFGSYHRALLEHMNRILDETNPEGALQLPEVKNLKSDAVQTSGSQYEVFLSTNPHF